MLQYLHSLIARDERGQGLAEYALILALIAVLAIVAVTFLGGQINAILSDVGNKIYVSSRSDKGAGRKAGAFSLPAEPNGRCGRWRRASLCHRQRSAVASRWYDRGHDDLRATVNTDRAWPSTRSSSR